MKSPKNGILLSHRRENLKSYIALTATVAEDKTDMIYLIKAKPIQQRNDQ
jgi:hypothetical protein